MKILLATYFQIPHVGGLWKYMQQVKLGLEREGHEVDLFGNGLDRYYMIGGPGLLKSHFQEMVYHKLTPESAPMLAEDPWVKGAEADRYYMELTLAYMGLKEYDVVHAQDVFAAAALSRVKPDSVPLVTSIHAPAALTVLDMLREKHVAEPLESLVWKYYKSMEILGSSVSDRILLASKWLKEVMTGEFSAPANRITLIPYALDITEFEGRMQEVPMQPLTKPLDKTVILSTSRLSSEKGIPVLLQALSTLYKERQDWECWLAGDGELRKQCEKISMLTGIQPAVRFLGSRDDVPYLLTQADVFAMSSLSETLSYSVMEAQLAGLPVASSSAGGLKEAVRHRVNGLLSEPGDPEGLYKNLSSLIADPSLRRRLGDNGRDWALKNRSLEAMVQRLSKVYAKQLALKSRV